MSRISGDKAVWLLWRPLAVCLFEYNAYNGAANSAMMDEGGCFYERVCTRKEWCFTTVVFEKSDRGKM